MVLDGAVRGRAFLANVEQLLVPKLNPGDIVIRANCPLTSPLRYARLLNERTAPMWIQVAFSSVRRLPFQ